MKEKITKFLADKKTSKIILIFGIIGIALIFASNLEKEETVTADLPEFSEEEYCQSIEEKIRQTVLGICADTSPVVMVTLDSGIVYEYASETKEKGSEDQNKTSAENETTFITVKDKTGAETPLVVTKRMPAIRGVSIICNASDENAEKIKNAVSAALDITKRKIYIGRKSLQ